MMNTVFCNIGWLVYYAGTNYRVDEYPRPLNGGKYNERHVGHEICNFKIVSGYCYGYVQPAGNGTQLHHDRYFLTKENKKLEHLDNVRVVWIANANGSGFGNGKRIVGWYNNATAFRKYQENTENAGTFYYFKARAEDCILLSEGNRDFHFTKIFRNTWYGLNAFNTSVADRELCYTVEKYIDTYSSDFRLPIIMSGSKKYNNTYLEGMTQHVAFEQKKRNSVVVLRAKEKFADSHGGKLFCEVCEFDFLNTYGELGEGFIEAHHINPFSERGEGEVRPCDFNMVCSNCHRMLHRNGNIGIEDLKRIILH